MRLPPHCLGISLTYTIHSVFSTSCKYIIDLKNTPKKRLNTSLEGKANQSDLGSLSTKTLSVIHLPGMTSTQQLLWAQIKKSSICPPFFASLFLFSASLSVYMVVGCLAVLMEMPAVWLLTPHQVHLLKWQSHLPGRRPLPSSLN